MKLATLATVAAMSTSRTTAAVLEANQNQTTLAQVGQDGYVKGLKSESRDAANILNEDYLALLSKHDAGSMISADEFATVNSSFDEFRFTQSNSAKYLAIWIVDYFLPCDMTVVQTWWKHAGLVLVEAKKTMDRKAEAEHGGAVSVEDAQAFYDEFLQPVWSFANLIGNSFESEGKGWRTNVLCRVSEYPPFPDDLVDIQWTIKDKLDWIETEGEISAYEYGRLLKATESGPIDLQAYLDNNNGAFEDTFGLVSKYHANSLEYFYFFHPADDLMPCSRMQVINWWRTRGSVFTAARQQMVAVANEQNDGKVDTAAVEAFGADYDIFKADLKII